MLGNVVGAPSVRYINLPMDRFKELAIAQMKAGESVWFGSDVGQVSDRQKGILATNVYDFTASMDINWTQDKAGRLDYSESLMTHAMVLTGVDLDADGKPIKWKIENSWGDKVGQRGTLLLLMLGWMNIHIKSLFAKISLQLKSWLPMKQIHKCLRLGTQWDLLLQNKRIFQKHWIEFQCF